MKKSLYLQRCYKKKIREQYGLPVSIGISHAKWIAKLATQSAKPYGIYEVKDIGEYIEDIPIQKFPGIGKGFQKRLSSHCISTLGELKRQKALLYSWKKPGIQLYKRVTGTDNERISTRQDRKSIGISRTFDPEENMQEVERRICVMARHIVYMVMATEANPASYILKIKYDNGIRVKESVRTNRIFGEFLFKKMLRLTYREIAVPERGTVKLSLRVSDFGTQKYRTFSLFELEEDMKGHIISKAVHQLREKFGLDIIKTANEL